MLTAAAHLLDNNSETKVVTSAYSSEDILDLNVEDKDGVPKLLCEELQSHKFKMADFSSLF